MDGRKKKTFLVIGIELVLGVLHIIGIGRNSSETLFMLSASYFSDLALPFGFYFLLSLNEEKFVFLKEWWMKAAIVFSAATLAEMGRYFGLYVLGRTFDPFDILVYALSVMVAAGLDGFLSKVCTFWKTDTQAIKYSSF